MVTYKLEEWDSTPLEAIFKYRICKKSSCPTMRFPSRKDFATTWTNRHSSMVGLAEQTRQLGRERDSGCRRRLFTPRSRATGSGPNSRTTDRLVPWVGFFKIVSNVKTNDEKLGCRAWGCLGRTRLPCLSKISLPTPLPITFIPTMHTFACIRSITTIPMERNRARESMDSSERTNSLNRPAA